MNRKGLQTVSSLVGWYRQASLMVLNTLVLLAIVEVSAHVVLYVHDWVTVNPEGQPKLYHAGEPWSDQFVREHGEALARPTYEPFVLWRPSPFAGDHVNITADRVRRTPGASCRDGAYRVFFFGGSAAWGYRSPDWGTIPAYLQSGLARRRSDVCVINYGQNGYVSTQQVIALLRLIQTGDIPNLVVFYDGYNDALATFETREVGVHYQLDQYRERFERRSGPAELLRQVRSVSAASRLISRALGPEVKSAPAGAPDEALIRGLVSAYLTNHALVDGMSRNHGFRFEAFWQPSLYAGARKLLPEERKIRPLIPASGPFFKSVYELVQREGAGRPHFTYLGNVFDDEPSRVWVDHVHATPVGNKIVADRILEKLAAAEGES